MLTAKPSNEHLQVRTSTLNLKLFQATISKFLEHTEMFFTSYLENTGQAWWVKIMTKKPDCTYYFGPFASHREAQLSQLGYIEDLERERPKLIAIEIKQCQPKELTIFEEQKEERTKENITQNISA